MKAATFVFLGSLNDFLPRSRRELPITLTFQGSQSGKHLIESLRVPHPEVRQVTANEAMVTLQYLVADGDFMQIYPFRPQDFSWPVPPRFLLDNHLGKLATYLRILGFDSAYHAELPDEALAAATHEQGRILLSRDRGLLMRKLVIHGYCLRSLDPHRQLAEILEYFNLASQVHPFKRCLRCNTVLEPVDKAAVITRLEPLTRRYYCEFHRCPACDRIYWKGSHYAHMQEFLKSIPGALQ